MSTNKRQFYWLYWCQTISGRYLFLAALFIRFWKAKEKISWKWPCSYWYDTFWVGWGVRGALVRYQYHNLFCKITVSFKYQKLLKVPDGTIGNSSYVLEGYFCGENFSRNDFSRWCHRFIEVPQINFRKVYLL